MTGREPDKGEEGQFDGIALLRYEYAHGLSSLLRPPITLLSRRLPLRRRREPLSGAAASHCAKLDAAAPA